MLRFFSEPFASLCAFAERVLTVDFDCVSWGRLSFAQDSLTMRMPKVEAYLAILLLALSLILCIMFSVSHSF